MESFFVTFISNSTTMKTKKLLALILLFLALTPLPQSCLEEEESLCGPKSYMRYNLIKDNMPVTMANFLYQEGMYSYYEFQFPSSLTDLELCVEEHCNLSCTVKFDDNFSQSLKSMKVDGMISVGFFGSPMAFTINGAEYTSKNNIGLQQSFKDMDYGWIYGKVKISFETYGTPAEEIDILNQLLLYLVVDFDYYERKQS